MKCRSLPQDLQQPGTSTEKKASNKIEQLLPTSVLICFLPGSPNIFHLIPLLLFPLRVTFTLGQRIIMNHVKSQNTASKRVSECFGSESLCRWVFAKGQTNSSHLSCLSAGNLYLLFPLSLQDILFKYSQYSVRKGKRFIYLYSSGTYALAVACCMHWNVLWQPLSNYGS